MRCFVACWPDDASRRHLDQAARDAHARCPGARRVRAENLHLTLAFIGELALPKAREAADAVRGVSSAPFDWQIDHVGHFERARVLWAGGPPEPRLEQMAERVRGELQTLRIRFDTKRFAAHVTLLRDVPPLGASGRGEVGRGEVGRGEPVEAIQPFAWPIRGALLLVSERDAQGATCYRPLASV
jgi:RNA 2',3'-cyclic 3'-phosphodiesterase